MNSNTSGTTIAIKLGNSGEFVRTDGDELVIDNNDEEFFWVAKKRLGGFYTIQRRTDTGDIFVAPDRTGKLRILRLSDVPKGFIKYLFFEADREEPFYRVMHAATVTWLTIRHGSTGRRTFHVTDDKWQASKLQFIETTHDQRETIPPTVTGLLQLVENSSAVRTLALIAGHTAMGTLQPIISTIVANSDARTDEATGTSASTATQCQRPVEEAVFEEQHKPTLKE